MDRIQDLLEQTKWNAFEHATNKPATACCDCCVKKYNKSLYKQRTLFINKINYRPAPVKC